MKIAIIIAVSSVISAAAVYISYFMICKTKWYVNKIRAEKARGSKYFLWFSVFIRWIENEQNGKKLSDYMLDKGYKNVAIYGEGVVYDLVYTALKEAEIKISYIIDSGAYEAGRRKDSKGFDIITAYEITDRETVDAIIVTPIYDYALILKKIQKIKADVEVISLDTIIYSL